MNWRENVCASQNVSVGEDWLSVYYYLFFLCVACGAHTHTDATTDDAALFSSLFELTYFRVWSAPIATPMPAPIAIHTAKLSKAVPRATPTPTPIASQVAIVRLLSSWLESCAIPIHCDVQMRAWLDIGFSF